MLQNSSLKQGVTIWFTGLSSAGKTTLSRSVGVALECQGYRVECLDGDVIRKQFCSDLGYSKHDRDINVRRLGFVARLLAKNGVVVLVSAISPYRAIRQEMREYIGQFIEVYVNAPLSVCEKRDVKGLYKMVRLGHLSGFTGIDDPYEPPANPDIECQTENETVEQSTTKVISYIERYAEARFQCLYSDDPIPDTESFRSQISPSGTSRTAGFHSVSGDTVCPTILGENKL